jgi:hypothetical protein
MTGFFPLGGDVLGGEAADASPSVVVSTGQTVGERPIGSAPIGGDVGSTGGAVSATGSVSAILGVITSTGEGAVTREGTVSAALGPVIASSRGFSGEHVVGVGAATLSDIWLEAHGAVLIEGRLAANLDAIALAARAAHRRSGAAALFIGA